LPAARSRNDRSESVGSIGFRREGLVVSLRTGFALFDTATGALQRLAEPLAERQSIRFNDGRVDRVGRFWAGTVHEKRERGTAALYRLDPEGSWSGSVFAVDVGTQGLPEPVFRG
jgi:sugar lactone lactonase YvrE